MSWSEADMSEPALVRLEIDGRVGLLTLDRPERLNALGEALCRALIEACERIGQDGSVHAVVLRGAGRAFCAGADLKERAVGGERAVDVLDAIYAASEALRSVGVPV